MSHETTRKNEQTIFRGLSSIGQKRASEILKTSEATVSKMKSESAEVPITFPKLAQLLTEMGLKLVPIENKCFNPSDIEEILSMAKKYMQWVNIEKLEF